MTVSVNNSQFEGENSELYFVGIIDLLQKFNSKKKIAGFAKSIKHSKVRKYFIIVI